MKRYQDTINKINELYVTERKRYLILNREGEYTTFTKGINSPMSLNDALLKSHLEGKHTVGVFSGSEFSKFICFDLDVIDMSQTRWMTYNILNILNELGFNDSDIHISSSGNKGIHILLFSNQPIKLSYFMDLFVICMIKLQDALSNSIISTLHKGNELVLEINDICNIEFRPNSKQGLKIELSKNFKNKSLNNDCLFLNQDTFKPIKDIQYFLDIEPVDGEKIKTIIEDAKSDTISEGVSLIKSNIKESYAHKINRDESETLDFIKDLLVNGMSTSGSRNNSIFKLSRYFYYCGMDLEESIVELKEWMLRQNKKYYNSPLDYCLSECERVARSVYEKGYSLVGQVENLKIYKDEMIEIMKIRDKNAKLIMFSLLLHSKRFANQKGIFYMTYAQIEEMCGLKISSASRNISILEDLKYIEVIDRNIQQKGTYMKRPNKYKVGILSTNDNSQQVLEIDNSNTNIEYNDLYYKTIINLFTDDELKETNLPKGQYYEFKNYRKLSA